jgi:hypothetical protein
VVVDDGLSPLDRGLADEDARAQACGHGQQGEGFQVRVQLDWHVAGRLGSPQLGGHRYMPHAEVAIIGGNHGGFDRIEALNDRMTAFIEAQAIRL